MQEYNAAADDQRRSNKQGLMTGLFNSLDDGNEADAAPEHLAGMQNLSFHPPQPSDEVFTRLSLTCTERALNSLRDDVYPWARGANYSVSNSMRASLPKS